MPALLHRRPVLFDLFVIVLPAAFVFVLASDFVVRRIFRRFAADEPMPRVLSLPCCLGGARRSPIRLAGSGVVLRGRGAAGCYGFEPELGLS